MPGCDTSRRPPRGPADQPSEATVSPSPSAARCGSGEGQGNLVPAEPVTAVAIPGRSHFFPHRLRRKRRNGQTCGLAVESEIPSGGGVFQGQVKTPLLPGEFIFGERRENFWENHHDHSSDHHRSNPGSAGEGPRAVASNLANRASSEPIHRPRVSRHQHPRPFVERLQFPVLAYVSLGSSLGRPCPQRRESDSCGLLEVANSD